MQTEETGEPLEMLARFSRTNADRLCPSEAGCADYHRAWSTVRLIETGGALPAGFDFFAGHLRALAKGRDRIRVLLSGAADSGLATLVFNVFRGSGTEVEIVLADCCRTTIEQNCLLAGHLGFPFEPHLTDITALDCAPVDAVIAHSFINFLPPENRGPLVAAWARLLLPGGFLLLQQSLAAPDAPLIPAARPAEEIADRRDELKARLHALHMNEQEIPLLLDEAEALWRYRPTNGRITEADLTGWLDAAGITITEKLPARRKAFQSPMGSHIGQPHATTFHIAARRS